MCLQAIWLGRSLLLGNSQFFLRAFLMIVLVRLIVSVAHLNMLFLKSLISFCYVQLGYAFNWV